MNRAAVEAQLAELPLADLLRELTEDAVSRGVAHLTMHVARLLNSAKTNSL